MKGSGGKSPGVKASDVKGPGAKSPGGNRPRSSPPAGASRPAGAAAGGNAPRPLDDREIDELQTLLDALPAPLEPFDVSALDGFLCGMLVQPEPVPQRRWLGFVEDADGRTAPQSPPGRARIHALVLRREAELRLAIANRRWFDPWVFELDDEDEAETDVEAEAGEAPGAGSASPSETVLAWVAGFAAALEMFPGLMARAGPELNEPLALVLRHLDPADLEDADQLLAEIDATEPPDDLPEAVEQLVRATLLLADAADAMRTG